jgi:hypothetical protein
MNSQSDLTIDQLFTIVTANAFNDLPARSHPQQGAKETPGLWETLWVTQVVSNEHPSSPVAPSWRQGNKTGSSASHSLWPPLPTTAPSSP